MIKKIFSIVLLSIVLFSCKTNESASEKAVNITEVQEILKSEPGLQVLDVRTPKEFADGHLAGAINMNIKDGDFEQQIQNLHKTKPVLVYCLAGVRSSEAAHLLAKNGFTKIYNFKDGMLGWRNNNLAVEGASATATNDPAAPGANMTMADYNQLLEGDKLVLVDFYAEWCGPCKAMAPFLDSMAAQHEKTLKLVRIDVDENQQIASHFGISAIPLLYGYKNKNKVWEQMGFADRNAIEEGLKQYLN